MGTIGGRLGRLGSSAGVIHIGNGGSLADVPGAHPSLAALFLLDEQAAGGVARDAFGAYTGTIGGTPTYQPSVSSFPGDGCIQFVASSYAKSGGVAINLAKGGIGFWARVATNPATGAQKALLVGIVESTTKYDKVFYLDSSGVLHFSVQNAAGAVTDVTSSAYPTGRWCHIFGHVTATQAALYVNGVLANVATFSPSRSDFTTGANLFIAGGMPGTTFVECPGVYSNVAAFNYTGTIPVISASEVLNDYSLGGAYLTLTGSRTTNALVEVARTAVIPGGKSRVTNLSAEVLRDGMARKSRVTNVTVEVLRTTAIGGNYSVGGTSTLNLQGTGLPAKIMARAGASTFSLAARDDRIVPHTYMVGGTSNLNLHVADNFVGPRIILASAASRLGLIADSDGGTGVVGHARSVFGATRLQVSGAGNAGHSSVFNVAARSTIRLDPFAVDTGAHQFSVYGVTSIGLRTRSARYVSPIFVSAASRLRLTPNASVFDADSGVAVSAASRLGLSALAAPSASHILPVAAASALRLTPGAAPTGTIRSIPVSAAGTLGISAAADTTATRSIHVDAVTEMGFIPTGSTRGGRLVAAASRLKLTGKGAPGSEFRKAASSRVTLAAATRSGRDIHASAVSSMGLAQSEEPNSFPVSEAETWFTLDASGSAVIGHSVATARLAFRDAASASVVLPDGGGIPGGEPNAGLRSVLMEGISGDYPMSYAETPAGLILIANGVDPMIRWDGLRGTAAFAGVTPPATPTYLAGSGVGTLTGFRYAYTRFIDREGNPSDLSPVSNLVNLGRDALIDSISYSPTTGLVTVRSDRHGLANGEVVVFRGVGGLPQVDGAFFVAVTGPDHFTITGLSVTSGSWTQGGSWTWGVATVVYNAIPPGVDQKVARRQILRNLDGSLDTLYVDIDTTDLLSPSLTSTRTDEDLAGCEAVPMFSEDDLPYASRYGVPPSHKAVVVGYQGRIFASVDVTVTAGCAAPTFGSATIQGIGTDWRRTFIGRLIYVTGATRAYEIAGVDEANQRLTLATPYGDQTLPFALYAIRSAPGERKLVYYSEPAAVESWPAWNALAVAEDNDEITGLMAKDSFLYVVEKRHIYKFSYESDPSKGSIFLSANRGAVNNRLIALVEDTAYMLDEMGIHAYDGGQQSEPISSPIQSLFQQDTLAGGMQVDWTADRSLWHAAHDPVRDLIRWFVAMVGDTLPGHAICYNYRSKRWWIEAYPSPITSSAVASVGYRRSIAGTVSRRVLVLSEGALDMATEGVGTLRGTATSGDPVTLTDSSADFAANLEGAPVSIVAGSGRGQQRVIASNSSVALEVVLPWEVAPDATSVYQIGGVPWSWRSGWFAISEDESSNPRDIEILYQPTVGENSIDLELFFDHAADPRIWGYTAEEDGVVSVDGDPVISIATAALDRRRGHVIKRFDGHNDTYSYRDQFVSVLLSGVQATEAIRVYQVNINGAAGGEQ